MLDGPAECECIRALAEAFPGAGLTIDPNGCWSLRERHRVAYAAAADAYLRGRSVRRGRRPQRPRGDGRVSPRDRHPDGDEHGGHRLSQGWWRRSGWRRSTCRWPIAISGRCAGRSQASQLCELWGLTWGSHSNNHFDVSLAMMTHVAAAAHGSVTPIDTHWIWQVGQRLTARAARNPRRPHRSADGARPRRRTRLAASRSGARAVQSPRHRAARRLDRDAIPAAGLEVRPQAAVPLQHERVAIANCRGQTR